MQLTEKDISLFSYIYEFKVLSLNQCWRLVYSDSTVNTCSSQLFLLHEEGYLLCSPDAVRSYTFTLTTLGIKTLYRERGWPLEIEDEWGKKIRNYKWPTELAVRKNILSHQLALNDFLIDFILRWKTEDTCGVSYRLEAEKGFRDIEFFRPDATIILKGSDGKNTFLFIEQDMGFESRRQLTEKWDRYRKFVETHRGDDEVNRMIMLFIVDYDTSKALPHNMDFSDMPACFAFRTREVCRSINGLLPSMLDGFFDTFINTKDVLMDCVFQRIIPSCAGKSRFEREVMTKIFREQLGLRVTKVTKIRSRFHDTSFTYYARKEEGGGIGKDSRGRAIAYLMDDTSFTPLSLLAKAMHMERTNAFSASYDSRFPHCTYLVYTPDASRFRELMKYCEIGECRDTEVWDASETGLAPFL